ncbi:MAG: beta-ketoacyl-ACP synthase II [Chlamydiales bacterium]|nr:beta-ketoacyl-ACP synthase II [Chlamydiales bacterium]
MNQKRRVVITGMGLVSCFGQDIDTFYQKLLDGESGITDIDAFDCSDYSTRIAGQIKNFDPGEYLDKKQSRRLDPFLRYSQVAGKRALEDAQVDMEALDKSRCGILIGSGMGGLTTFSEGVHTIRDKGCSRITPFFIPFIITNMASGMLSIDTGFTGPNYSVSTACATANYAIINAARHIQNGDADLMVCGGSEAPIVPVGLAGFCVIKAMSTRNDEPLKASRPWDKGRDGFIMGEGAGVLILEELEHAKKRGAKIYGEYLGGAMNADAYHLTATKPDGSGVAECIRMTLKDGNIDPKRVNYINAHATSTPVGDMCEVRGIQSIFGEQCKEIAMNGTKALIGHCLGAAGSIELIATLKSIEKGKIHPMPNLDDPEEEIKEFIVPSKAVDHDIDVALSNSFGFGGHNAVVAVGRYKP